MKYLSLTLPNTSFDKTDPITVLGPAGIPTTSALLYNIPQFLVTTGFTLAVVLALAFIIYSGIQWIISGGDEKKKEAARNRLTYSIVGLLVVFVSFLIVGVVFQLFGINKGYFNLGPSVQKQESDRLRLEEQDYRMRGYPKTEAPKTNWGDQIFCRFSKDC